MASRAADLPMARRADWRTALPALLRLLSDAGDTAQVFRIMQALNGGVIQRNYDRLIRTREGGRIAFEHVELAERFGDPAWLAEFGAGSVGAAYAEFLRATGFSAQGLAEVGRVVHPERIEHPYAWFGRRQRDTHDVWHVLTGYAANAPLGEACLVAFTYAQTGGPGWALIAIGIALKAIARPHTLKVGRALWEGYRNGRAAAWLAGEDYERLFAEPIDTARARLRIKPARRYQEARAALAADGAL
ncbi:MAG: ubiquinone biosynthesis protein [Sphingomonadaceae bacterium]|nr:ubiquinone biosynthesis protein [Sphingomonadaceae bacterium]